VGARTPERQCHGQGNGEHYAAMTNEADLLFVVFLEHGQFVSNSKELKLELFEHL
jgi:hypothetical protein